MYSNTLNQEQGMVMSSTQQEFHHLNIILSTASTAQSLFPAIYECQRLLMLGTIRQAVKLKLQSLMEEIKWYCLNERISYMLIKYHNEIRYSLQMQFTQILMVEVGYFI